MRMKKMNVLDWVALIILALGGLNWGLVGLFEYDIIANVFGDLSTVSKAIYVLVGAAAVYMIASAFMKMQQE